MYIKTASRDYVCKVCLNKQKPVHYNFKMHIFITVTYLFHLLQLAFQFHSMFDWQVLCEDCLVLDENLDLDERISVFKVDLLRNY